MKWSALKNIGMAPRVIHYKLVSSLAVTREIGVRISYDPL